MIFSPLFWQTWVKINGEGTFKPMEGAKPFVGKIGERKVVEEIKIETVVPERNLESVIEAMKKAHPYKEPAYDIYELKINQSFGIGILGEIAKNEITLPNPINYKFILALNFFQ